MGAPERKLSPRALELLGASDAERSEHIDKSVFIPYERAAVILAEMESLLVQPKTNRMSNLLIIGRSDNGKTDILKEFTTRHPAEDRPEFDTIYAPVTYIQSPPGPSEHIFLDMIIRKHGMVVRPNDSADRKLMQILEILKRVQTKLLIVDELGSLLAGSATKQRFYLNMLKYISNELQISIVAAGTLEAQYAVDSDAQIKSRFPRRTLPRWKEDKEFKKLLYSFEYIFPLKRASEVYKGELAAKLYGLSEGIIGEVAKILRSAAKYAIETKEERITLDVIAKCEHVVRRVDDSLDVL